MKIFTSIARLFWPKEMKELVAKYEAEGTLNEEAVKSYNKKQFIGLVAFMCCLLFDETPYYIASFVVLIITNIVILHIQFKHAIIPYTLGELQWADLVTSYFERAYLSYNVCYEHCGKTRSHKINKENYESLIIDGNKILVKYHEKSGTQILFMRNYDKSNNLDATTLEISL